MVRQFRGPALDEVKRDELAGVKCGGNLGNLGSWQERLPHSELAVARARGGCEDKGRWFALSEKSVTAEQGDQGAGQRRRRD